MSGQETSGARAALYALDAVQTDLEGLLERTRARRDSLSSERAPLATEAADWMEAVASYIEALLRNVPEAD